MTDVWRDVNCGIYDLRSPKLKSRRRSRQDRFDILSESVSSWKQCLVSTQTTRVFPPYLQHWTDLLQTCQSHIKQTAGCVCVWGGGLMTPERGRTPPTTKSFIQTGWEGCLWSTLNCPDITQLALSYGDVWFCTCTCPPRWPLGANFASNLRGLVFKKVPFSTVVSHHRS